MRERQATAEGEQDGTHRPVDDPRTAAALVPARGRPERDPRVAVRQIAEGRFDRALFVATRVSDRARPSTAAVVAAIRAA